MIDFKETLKQSLKDDEFKKAYDDSRFIFELKKKLIKARIEAKLSQKDLADSIGVKQSVVARFENLNTDFKISTLRNYIKACGRNIEFEIL